MTERAQVATYRYVHSGSRRIKPRIMAPRIEVHSVLWVLVLSGAVLLFAIGASGILATKLFHQYSTLKWMITLGGPLLIILLLTVKRPAAWATGILILTIPIEPYVTTISSQPISILFATSLLATAVVTIEGGVKADRNGKKPALAAVVPWIALLLVLPSVLGTGVDHQVLYLFLFVDIAWVCARVVGLYPDGRSIVVLVFVGSAAAQSTLALVQHVTGQQYSLYGGAGTVSYSAHSYFYNYGSAARTTGTFFDPISLGNVLAMALPMAMLIVLRRDSRTGHRWFAGLSSLLIVGGLAVSLSRASWMGAIAGVLCISLFSHGDQRRRAISYSGVLIVGVLLVASAWYGPAISSRFTSILHPTASTVRTASGDKTRQVDWSFALKTFEENPIAGVGIGNLAGQYQELVAGSGAGTHASDVYLQYLAEGGLFGGAALVLLAGAVFVDLFRARRTDWLYPGLAGAFVSVGITWVTDFTVRYYAVAGCLAILIGLAASGSHRPVEDPLPARSGREPAVLG